jgi:monothiol glutaredoxin
MSSQFDPIPMLASEPEPEPAPEPAPEPEPAAAPASAPSGEGNAIRDAIAEAIGEHKVILFMKGTPDAPACGFSARTVAILQSLEVPFAAVDVLPDPRIRSELSELSSWPTIPQLFFDGELIGGCDIVTEMYESGELAQTLL